MNKLLLTVSGLTGVSLALAGCGQREETTVVTPPEQRIVREKTTVVSPQASPTPSKIIVEKPVVVKKTEVVENNKTVIEKRVTPAPTPRPTPTGPTPAKPNPTPAFKLPPVSTPKPAARPAPTPVRKATPTPTPPTSASKNLVINATVVSTSKVPNPSSVAYSQSLVFTKYSVKSVEKGTYPDGEILVAQWGMKNKKLTPAARLRAGDTVRLTLVPLASRPELEKVMRNDDTNAYELEPYFAVSES